MSTSGIWALVALVAVLFAGAWLISRLALTKPKAGEPFRLKMPFIEIETGPPLPDPRDTDDKHPERRPSVANSADPTETEPKA